MQVWGVGGLYCHEGYIAEISLLCDLLFRSGLASNFYALLLLIFRSDLQGDLVALDM